MTQAASTAAEAISRAAREERGRLVALLARHFGDVDLADESVQDALEEAVRTWSERGVPDNPAGWLLTVARRKAVDRLRRATSAQRRLQVAAPDLLMQATAADVESEGAPMTLDEAGIQDDQLRLILLCCHPALDPDAQVALVLRLVAGLTTSEIAAAFLVPEPTLAQRIVRAKRKIRDAKIPLVIPAAIEQRSATVLRVLYFIFNEGYLMHGPGTNAIRVDLADEAIRLTRLVVELLPNSTEAKGLLALQLFHHSRRASRVDDAGDLVLLEAQDRTGWDLEEIHSANGVLAAAMGEATPGPFQLQAVIAAHHANARTAADTHWPAIVTAYERLLEMTGSSVVALNRAVALAMTDGPRTGLAALDDIEGLDAYHLYHATRGELLQRTGDALGAADSFRRARALATNPAEQRHLDRRLEAVVTSPQRLLG